MKKPAASRSLGRQQHRCSACGRCGHRINTCKHPAAEKIRQLSAQLRALNKGTSQKRTGVIRKENKQRKSKQDKNKTVVNKRREAYSGVGKARTPSPAEMRRNVPTEDVLKEAMASEECAQTWLLRSGFAWKPKMCDSSLREQEGRSAHWRCKKCGQRTLFLTLPFFNGFRCSCVLLLNLFRAYVKEDFAESPQVANWVQATRSSKKQAMHFIQVARDIEGRAGERLSTTLTLRGNVECDGTSLRKEIRAGRAKPKSFCVLILLSDGMVQHCCISALPACLVWHCIPKTNLHRMIFLVLPFLLLIVFSKMRSLYSGAGLRLRAWLRFRKSRLPEQVAREHRSVSWIFADGNKSWESHAKLWKIPHAKVCHQNKEWTRKVPKSRNEKISNVAGTQIADRGWLSLKRFIPASFPRRIGRGHEIKEHPERRKLVMQYMWRRSLGPCAPTLLLNELCKVAKQSR